MEDVTGKSLVECQKVMDGKVTNGNGKEVIPSCCLKAKTSDPKLEAQCHSTVVSGWFSEFQSGSGNSQFL